MAESTQVPYFMDGKLGSSGFLFPLIKQHFSLLNVWTKLDLKKRFFAFSTIEIFNTKLKLDK